MPGPLGSVGSVYVDIEANLDGMQNAMALAVPAAAQAGEAAGKSFTEGWVSSVNQGTQATQELTKSFEELGATVKDAGGSLVTIGAAVTVISGAFAELGLHSLEVAGDFERTTIAMGALLGSAHDGAQEVDLLIKKFTDSGVAIETVTDQVKKMIARGFDTTEANKMIATLLDTVNALGTGDAGLNRLVGVFDKLSTSSDLSARIIQQLAANGIPALKILSEQLGITVDQVKDEVQKKLIDANTAMDALMAGLQERYGGMTAKIAETFNGMWVNIENHGTLTFKALGDALLPLGESVEKAIVPLIDDLTKAFEWFGKLPEPVKEMTAAVVALGVAAGAATTALGGILYATGGIMQGLPALVQLADAITGVGTASKATAVAETEMSVAATTGANSFKILAGVMGEVALGAAAIHFAGIDSTLLEMVEKATQDFKDLQGEVSSLGIDAGVLERSMIGLLGEGILPVDSGLKGAAQTIAEFADKTVTLQGSLRNLLGGLGIAAWANDLTKAAAASESLTGKSKTMEDALAGLNSKLVPAYDSTTALAGATDKLSSSAQKIIDQQAAANQALQTAQTAYNDIAAAVKAGTASQEALARATANLEAAEKAATPATLEHKAAIEAATKAAKDQEEQNKKTGLAIAAMTNAGIDWTTMSVSMIQSVGKILEANQKANESFDAAVDIYKQLKLVSDGSTESQAALAVALADVYEKAAKAHPELRNNAAALDEVVRAATGGAQQLKTVADALAELADKSIKSKNDLQVWTDVVKQLAPLQGTAAADSAQWARALTDLKNAFAVAHPEVKNLDAAFQQYISDQGISTQASSGMITVMKNGIPVIEGTAGGVKSLSDMTTQGAASVRGYTNAWSDAVAQIKDADGNVIALTHDMNVAAAASKLLAQAGSALGASAASYASQRSSAATKGTLGQGQSGSVDGLQLAAFAAAATDSANVILHPEFGVGQNGQVNGPHGLQDLLAALNPTVISSASDAYQNLRGSTAAAGSAATGAADDINQFGESLSGVGDAARKTAEMQASVTTTSTTATQATQAFSSSVQSAGFDFQNIQSDVSDMATGWETLTDRSGNVLRKWIGGVQQLGDATNLWGDTFSNVFTTLQRQNVSFAQSATAASQAILEAQYLLAHPDRAIGAAAGPAGGVGGSTSFLASGDVNPLAPGQTYQINGQQVGYSQYLAYQNAHGPSGPSGSFAVLPSASGYQGGFNVGNSGSVPFGSPGAGTTVNVNISGGVFSSQAVGQQIGAIVTDQLSLTAGQKL